MNQTTAAVFQEQGNIELRSIALPELSKDELLVKVLGCTLCGSDLHSFEGRRKVPTPSILGHEIVGEIVDEGERTPLDICGQLLRVGDRVSWSVVANCDRCFYCLRGWPQKCLNATKYGHEALKPGRELVGGLAEHCLLVSGTKIMRWPSEVPLEVACPASCATATAMAAIEAIKESVAKALPNNQKRERELTNCKVAILGAGMLGLTACAIACTLGASVMCFDPVANRRDWALRFGAHTVGDPKEIGSISKMNTDGFGFDAVIEMSGTNAAFENTLPHVRIGGAIVLIGSVFSAPPISIHLEQIVRRCLDIQGIHNYGPNHLRAAVEFLSQNYDRYPFDSLVDSWWPLSKVVEAIDYANKKGVVRVGIRPDI
jgi:putative phosphonate catabolism associated alcohol dehydrogenase